MRFTATAPAVLMALGSAAHADTTLSAAADVQAGAGHDTNLFLAVDPAGAGAPVVGGWFVRAAPSAVGALSWGRSAGHRVELSYDGDLRTGAFGPVYFQESELSLSLPPLSLLRLRAAVRLGAFDASQHPGNRFRFAGADLGMRIEPSSSLRVSLALSIEARRFPDVTVPPQVDRFQVGHLRVAYVPIAEREAGLLIWAVAAGDLGGAYWRLRTGPYVRLVLGPCVALASASVGAIGLGAEDSRTNAAVAASLRARLSNAFDVVAGLDWTDSFGVAAQAWDARRAVFVGVAGHLGTRWRRATLEASPTDLRPAVVAGQVRFRTRAPTATDVQLIGSWDGWSTPGLRLVPSPAEAGLWEGLVSLPRGAHRYRFVVDGAAQRPLGAPRYQKDDFGEEDGVIDVP